MRADRVAAPEPVEHGGDLSRGRLAAEPLKRAGDDGVQPAGGAAGIGELEAPQLVVEVAQLERDPVLDSRRDVGDRLVDRERRTVLAAQTPKRGDELALLDRGRRPPIHAATFVTRSPTPRTSAMTRRDVP